MYSSEVVILTSAVGIGSLTISTLLTWFGQSVSLGLTRAIGLFFASAGGAIGTNIWPGWGTVIGINMGDGLAISITDELVIV